MKKYKLLIYLFCIIIFSSCNQDLKIYNFDDKSFNCLDSGSILFKKDVDKKYKVYIKFPMYFYEGKGDITIYKVNGERFDKIKKDYKKRLDFDIIGIDAKIVKKDGKFYINAKDKFPNFRFQLKDKFTIIDTEINTEYLNSEKYRK